MKQVVHARLQRYWDIRAAGNFAFGGTGSGLVLATALGYALGLASPLALLVALATVGLGLFCVWLEIGKPWRAINVIFHPHTSWMTREAMVVPFLTAAGAAALIVDFRIVYVAAAFAALFMYCQARMLLASRGIPAWCQKEIVPLILATGVTEGLAAFVLIAGAAPGLVMALLAMAVVRELVRELYRRGLVAGKTPAGTLAWLASGGEMALLGLRLAAIGALILATAGVMPGILAIAGAALALVTGWALKVMIVTRAAFMRGHIIVHTPTRGRGPTEIVIPS